MFSLPKDMQLVEQWWKNVNSKERELRIFVIASFLLLRKLVTILSYLLMRCGIRDLDTWTINISLETLSLSYERFAQDLR